MYGPKESTSGEYKLSSLVLLLLSISSLILGMLIIVNFLFVERAGGERPDVELPEKEVIEGDTRDVGPREINIPAISVRAHVDKLELQDDGELEVPENYTDVGWYRYSAIPGDVGASVIVGHVDSYEGPAVFFDLKSLRRGDLIEVRRSDGQTARFAVERLEEYFQSDFPTREVYGEIDYAGLRLITCSGDYDRQKKRYSHNLIIFAKRI